jgi:hypothetical protein
MTSLSSRGKSRRVRKGYRQNRGAGLSKSLKSVLGDDALLLLTDEGHGCMLRRKLQREASAREPVTKVDGDVFGGFGFQYIEDGIL